MAMEKNIENCVEWLTGDEKIGVSFTQKKYINKIKKLYEKHKDSFSYFIENADGSICAEVPIEWLKISPKRAVSEEQREAARERLQQARETKGS